MTITSQWRPRVIAVLLVVSAVLFVVGVTSESDSDTHSDEPNAEAEEHSEANETPEARASETAKSAEASEPSDERVLGLDLESPIPIALALVLSAVLAAGALWRPGRQVLVAIAVIAAGFAVLDVAEVSHQLDEDHTGLAVLAATIAAMHATAAALAIWQFTDSTSTTRSA